MTKKTFSRGKKVLSQSYSTLLGGKVSCRDDSISMQMQIEKRMGNVLRKKEMKLILVLSKKVILLTISTTARHFTL